MNILLTDPGAERRKELSCLVQIFFYVFLLKIWEMYLTIVKLTIWLFTVDDVKPVTNASFHSTNFKVKPLMIMIAIYIRVQN